MSISESNSLLRGLAAKAPTGEHPSADLLTAFAEGSLRARERETLMAHLAVCAECREVLSLSAVGEALPAQEPQISPTAEPHVLATEPTAMRKSRPHLRAWVPWGAVAATIAIVSVIAFRDARRPIQTPSRGETQTAEVKAPPVPAPVAQAPIAHPQSTPQKKAAAEKQSVQNAPLQLKAGGIAGSLQSNQPARDEALDQKAAGTQAEQQFYQPPLTQALQQFGPSQAKSGAQMQREMRSQRQGSREETDHLARSAASAQSPSSGPLAPAPALSNSIMAATSALERPHWRINELGHPERSFGNGPWEPVLNQELARMHVISVANGTVWVGGESDRVYQSRDNGETWQPVALAEKNGSAHVIILIRFDSAQAGTIEASDGTRWITSDGGVTWN